MPRVQNQDPQQRDQALANANRLGRANLKRKIKAGDLSPLEVIQEPSQIAAGMRVRDLLLAVPLLGPKKIDRILVMANIPLGKRIENLTERQVWELDLRLSRLGPWCRALSRTA